MSVYFIACGGFIKVGFSDDPEKRTKNLFQSGSRYTAPRAAFADRKNRALVHAIEGDKGTESNIHVALRDFSAGCEWFVDEPALREWIATAPGDHDRWKRQEYAPLTRAGGPVDLPHEEQGGCNSELVMATFYKARERAVTA